ncbi:MAG: hypothetical protein N4A72_20785 [Bacteroidales bacterium]|nr:hypothetical protein [Bacteroidales bacterium]
MRSIFKISFKGETEELSNKKVLENFKENLTETYCDHIIIKSDNELIVRNDFFRFLSRRTNNIWSNVKEAKVIICDDKVLKKRVVVYSIDFTRLITSLVLAHTIIISALLIILDSESYIIIAFLPLLMLIVSSVSFFITLLEHRSVFRRTLKYGTDYTGNYDWETIIKNKSDRELKDIITGRKHLPVAVRKLAESEMKNRGKRNN